MKMLARVLLFFGAVLVVATPASAQIELSGSYEPRLYEDYIERGPGSDLGDFSGMPLNDEGRAKALLRNVYTPPASCGRYCCGWIERQGLPGGAPNLTCNDGGFAELGPRGRRRTPDR